MQTLKSETMKPIIFINLPVEDLKKSMGFYREIGFTNNPQFTDETAACMVFSDEISVMLLTHSKFREFTPKEISDATKTSEVLNCLALESKERVDQLTDRAIAAGGSVTREPHDYGFMFGRSFNDPDGHSWELIWIDPEHIQ